ncbi:MAG: sulfotransferase, partial [Pseudomonadales bacterium]
MSNKTPNLFILGAPKCGTTTLAAWLAKHPKIYFSPEKEPHYFYSPYDRVMSDEAYAKLFAEAPEDAKYLAEASVWYLFGGVAVPQILEVSPESRFIVCLRNPVQMAPSLHAQTLYV